jgi:hypothetical protein
VRKIVCVKRQTYQSHAKIFPVEFNFSFFNYFTVLFFSYVLVGKPIVNRPLEKLRNRLEDNISKDLK